MNQKGFTPLFLILGLIFISGLVFISYNQFSKNKADLQNTVNVPTQKNQSSGFDKEFRENAVAYIKGGQQIILVDPDNLSSEVSVFKGNKCDSIKVIKWSPDKSKLAYYKESYLVHGDECYSNKIGSELGYIDLKTKKVNIINKSSNDIYPQETRYLVNSISWDKETNTFAFNKAEPINVQRIFDSELEGFKKSDDYGPGWGSIIKDAVTSPDGEKLIYELNIPKEISVILVNLKNNSKKKILAHCKDSTTHESFAERLGDFSPNSSMLTIFDNCNKDYNLLLFSSEGKLLKTFPYKNTRELINSKEVNTKYIEYDYGTKFSSFSTNGKKILLINQKWESDNNKVKPDVVLTQYAFIIDLKNDHISKINFSGTDAPVKFSRAFLEDSDEIVDLKWSD